MKIIKWFDEHFEEVILVFLLVLISCVMLAQVFARYVFNNSMSWPEEFCRYCYIWTVFLSLAYTIRKGNMLRVGVVMDLFPAKIQSTVNIVIHLIMLALCVALFRQSTIAVNTIKNITREISSAMRIPMWMMYMSTVVGYALAVIRIVQLLVSDVRNFNKKMESTIEATIKEAQAEAELAQHDDEAFREGTVQRGEA